MGGTADRVGRRAGDLQPCSPPGCPPHATQSLARDGSTADRAKSQRALRASDRGNPPAGGDPIRERRRSDSGGRPAMALPIWIDDSHPPVSRGTAKQRMDHCGDRSPVPGLCQHHPWLDPAGQIDCQALAGCAAEMDHHGHGGRASEADSRSKTTSPIT